MLKGIFGFVFGRFLKKFLRLFLKPKIVIKCTAVKKVLEGTFLGNSLLTKNKTYPQIYIGPKFGALNQNKLGPQYRFG